MLFAVLIYGNEGLNDCLPEEEVKARLDNHRALQAAWSAKGGLVTTAKLMPTSSAVTLREENRQPLLLDGPFAETKEQFLGFYLLECRDLNEAIEAAKMLPLDNHAVEVRPVAWAGGKSVRP